MRLIILKMEVFSIPVDSWMVAGSVQMSATENSVENEVGVNLMLAV